MAELQLCALASREYLPYVRVLAHSIEQFHPGTRLKVLLVFDLDRTIDVTDEPFDAYWSDEVGFDEADLHRLYLMHGLSFFAIAKIRFLSYLVETTGAPTLYIDSDVGLYGPLHDLADHLEHHGALLTPHTLTPFPKDGRTPDDTTILNAGTFNSGIIGLGTRGAELARFLAEELRRECVIDITRNRVADQRWLDLFPSFGTPYVLRDAGVNCAYWNLHERPLRRVEGVWYTGDRPLRAFHFSGYDPANPDQLSVHPGERARIVLAEHPEVRALCDEFRDRLLAAGWSGPPDSGDPFAALPGGIPVDAELRSVYRSAVLACEAQGIAPPPDPYDNTTRPLFLAWVQLVYRATGRSIPSWAMDPAADPPVTEVTTAPVERSAAPPPVAPTPVQPGPTAVELVNRLANDTAAGLTFLSDRLTALEHEVASLRRREGELHLI